MLGLTSARTARAANIVRAAFAALVLTVALVAAAGPAAGDAHAGSYKYWGYQLDWKQTNKLANMGLSEGLRRATNVGIPLVSGVMLFSYRQTARWSVYQGKCMGIWWGGSALTVRC